MAEQRYTLKTDHGLARLSLHGLSPVNGANGPLALALADLAEELALDEQVRAIVLTGLGHEPSTGEEAARPDGIEARLNLSLAGLIAGLDRPVIAVLQGRLFGQALELALACDLRICSSEAVLALDGLAWGDLPGDGGGQRLARLIGRGRAMDMLLTGRSLSAAEALAWGLVSRVCPAGELLDRAEAAGRIMAEAAFNAVRYVREAVNQGLEMSLEQGLRLEADLYFLLHTTRDRREGIEAFQARRPPVFSGE